MVVDRVPTNGQHVRGWTLNAAVHMDYLETLGFADNGFGLFYRSFEFQFFARNDRHECCFHNHESIVSPLGRLITCGAIGLNNGGMTQPDLGNWLHAEHVFWSFRNVRSLIPVEDVAAGDKVLSLADAVQPELGELLIETSHHEYTLNEFLTSSHSDSLIVIKNIDGVESVVYEWHAEGVGADEPHLNFSVTKSITSLLVGALVGQGLIEVDGLVTDYVPAVRGSGFDGATIRHLLDMTASYSFVEDYSPGPDITAYRHSAGWYPAPSDAPTLREFIASRGAEGNHGERFRYLSPTTDMLGWVCEEVSGLSYAQALSKYVWQPMGAGHDAHMTIDRAGSPRAAGGLSSTVHDLARIGILVRDGGRGIIPAEYIEDIFINGSPEQWAIGDFIDLFAHGVYRSCFYRPGEDPDVLMGIGIHGQMLYVDRPRGVVIAKQSSWPQPDELDWHLDAYAALRTIARSFDD